MSRALVPCQCFRTGEDLQACHRHADAEDLLCRICRYGCRPQWWLWPADRPQDWRRVHAAVLPRATGRSLGFVG